MTKKVILQNTNWISRLLAKKAQQSGSTVYYKDVNGTIHLFEDYINGK
jgi:hypothetical protein